MKALTSPELPRQRVRRVSKPVMEKRRRERINHSLETLRLLMLESTRDERLNNPKVEKAEILESVVHFLQEVKDVRKGNRAAKRVSREHGHQQGYQEGMRSCLLRISHFVESAEEPGGRVALRPSTPSHIHRTLLPAGDTAVLYPHRLTQHPLQDGLSNAFRAHRTDMHGDTSMLLSPQAAPALSDPVWRPWPQ